MQARTEGTLTKWNDDRGFGFITPTEGGPEVFVHISAFPKDGQRPQIGERIVFEIESIESGKTRAKNLMCPGRTPAIRNQTFEVDSPRVKPRSLKHRIALILLAVLMVYGYDNFSRRHPPQVQVSSDTPYPEQVTEQYSPMREPEIEHTLPSSEHATEQVSPSHFECDGRTSCPQMKSCAEATFFLNNCPNVKMDGDHDGIPCEDQLCSARPSQ